jgi:hypothetical protein
MPDAVFQTLSKTNKKKTKKITTPQVMKMFFVNPATEYGTSSA